MENNNNQDNGLELLKKVIETNERSIEQGIKTEFLYQDLLFLKGETESTMRGLNSIISDVNKNQEKENAARNQFIEKIPKTIEVKISDDSLNQIHEFEKKAKGAKYLIFGSIGILILSIIFIITIGKLAMNWYSESVRTKSEIRQEIFTEIEKEGKSIYSTSDLEQLKQNTILMNKWIQKKPKDSESFLRFKEGFESR
ncbi:hypothetical protein SAMN05660493_02151 [Epilithonimonas bovis DSM 19482]|uniref:Uncharacterized protein n=1 Tax=Epilithonimonas bovis DSM 19482 TaxID=1121284 RepID=A0A1U7PY48_9FLAO|nr:MULTISPECIES: hypothetical protein [Chryseobacterium group]MPS65115.1 hypothetical protein [Chryseobacterium sp.]SIT97434.1 hypothetical protein SAMN05660493_02151 [Epilithonimonas bovis DSM 19482]